MQKKRKVKGKDVARMQIESWGADGVKGGSKSEGCWGSNWIYYYNQNNYPATTVRGMLAIPHLNKREFHQKYRRLQRIGSGNFGVVYNLQEVNTNRLLVLKVIKCNSPTKYQQALTEIRIQTALDHPLVLKIFEYYDILHSNPSQPHLYDRELGLIVERGYCSLEHALRDHHYTYDTEDLRKLLAKFIALGAHMQNLNLVHRDIKPANFIVMAGRLDVKLADFGLACEESKRPNGFAGTLCYSSPWLNRYYQKGDNSLKHLSNGFKDDVYSLGKTVKEALLKIEPKGYAAESAALDNLKSILSKMLCESESQRPDFKDLLQLHPFQSLLKQKPVSEDTRWQEAAYESPQPKTLRKMDEKLYEQNCRNTDKHVEHYDPVQYNLGKFCLRTMQRINNRFILCGSEDGHLLMFDTISEQKFYLNLIHNPFVVRIITDQEDNVWTIGGDGTIYRFLITQLIRLMEDAHKLPTTTKKFLFGRQHIEERIVIIVPETVYWSINANEKKKEAVSYLQAIDDNTFAVGYADGSVCGKYNGVPFHFDTFSDLITTLKFQGNLLYSSGYNGMVKIYDLKDRHFVNRYFLFDEPVIDFQVGQQQYHLTAVTPARLIVRHESEQEDYCSQKELEARNIIACCFRNQNEAIFYLTDNGQLYDGSNPNPMANCPTREGWNCLHYNSRELLMGSYNGRLAILNLSQ